jgi:DNA polymerase-3 subunit alpha
MQPRKKRNPEEPDVFKLKINSIQLLSEVKDKLIEKITISVPLHGLDVAMVEDLSSLIKNRDKGISKGKGSASLYFNVMDGENNMKLELFARSIKVQVNKELITYLTESEHIDFRIN